MWLVGAAQRRPLHDHRWFVWTTEDRAVAAGHSVDPDRWRQVFEDGFAVVAGRFGRREPRTTAKAFVKGLLSPVERKTCWSVAEQAGYAGPASMQRLLRTAAWDADAAGADVRAFVAGRLGHPDGVLV